MTMADDGNERMSFRDRRKFFEKEIKRQTDTEAEPKPVRKFSYLSEDEIAKMKQEEEKKIASTTQQQLLQSYVDDQQDYTKMLSGAGGSPPDGKKKDSPTRPLSMEERARQAEERSAWRQARIKSLEEDALKAQIVIAKVKELSQKSEESGLSGVEVDGKRTNNNDLPNNNKISPPSSTRMKKLRVHTRDGSTNIEERSRIVGEKVTRQIEEYVDEKTGKTEFRTIEYIEKTIEHETETTKQQIVELELESDSDRNTNGRHS